MLITHSPKFITKLPHIILNFQEDDGLYESQQKQWDPVIQWFCDRFHVDIKKTRGFVAPAITPETNAALTKHLMSYNTSAVNGTITLQCEI